jgi:hypothetical protein
MIGFELQCSADDRHVGRNTRTRAAEALACSLLVGRDRRISKIQNGAHYTKKPLHGKSQVPTHARLAGTAP